MSRRELAAVVVFVGLAAAGTVTDAPQRRAPASSTVLLADFHVHAMPGDGFLPVWEIQKEAARRGIDAVAITNHNHHLAIRVAQRLGLLAEYPLVLAGQELTTPSFHMAVVGVATMIDSRLSARQALEAIHAQGGIGIAAHPVAGSWLDADEAALGALDGAEVAHPTLRMRREWGAELAAFYERARAVNPDLAAIGSSDFHGGPLGLYCTAVTVSEPTGAAVLDAVRAGRTVAYGFEASPCPSQRPWRGLHTLIALGALLALAVLSTPQIRPF